MTKPQKFNIIKNRGQLNKATDPFNGKTYERAEWVFILENEHIAMAKTVYDPDHFIYQRHMPQTETDMLRKYPTGLPVALRGPVVMCTCGAMGVKMLEGPHAGLILCKSVALFGKHQTSFKVKDGELILDKKTADGVMLTDAEMQKNLWTPEQERAVGI